MHNCHILIIGAGSAGATLAARLSENPDLQVTLVEAGCEARNRWVDIPIGYFKTVGDPQLDWGFMTEADQAMAGRQLPWPRGKGLGGTSLINGMLYLRGHRKDYDHWAAMGNAGWAWEDVLPQFMRSQHRAHASGPSDGKNGPLWVSDLPRDALSDAFIESASACGIAKTADFNGGDNSGAGYFQMTTRAGVRMSTARAFLEPVRQRSNLRVLTGLRVTKLLFEGKRATGAQALDASGEAVTLKAQREVVLCAGAVQSPQLLMLSGVGHAAPLQAMGITPLHHLPGVGKNLQDHLQVRPSFRCRNVVTLNDIANSRWRSAVEFLRYQFFKTGALNAGVYRAGAFLSLASEPSWPDVQVHFGLVSFDRPHQPPHPFPGITLSACLLRPYSRGEICLASKDPLAAPRIQAGYLSDPRDQQLAVVAVRKMQQIASQAPLSRFVESANEPPAKLASDADLLSWVRQRSGSIFHPVGTCAMGSSEQTGAVVDSQFRVHGLQALRVVDASAMPTIVSGNTNAPIIMMAERAAQWIGEATV